MRGFILLLTRECFIGSIYRYTGWRMTVVRVFWEHVDRVRLSASRQGYIYAKKYLPQLFQKYQKYFQREEFDLARGGHFFDFCDCGNGT